MSRRPGSPFRPLYDDKILFNGQPVALVVAETSEVARFAASLVRVEYEQEPHVTDCIAQRDAAVPATAQPAKPVHAAEARPPEALLRRPLCVTRPNITCPIEHHNPMELYAATVIYEGGGKLTVYDKTQGVQNVQRYLCSVFGMKPEDVRVMSPFVGGAFGSGLRPQYRGGAGGAGGARAQALGARGADPPADVRARLSARDDPADRARRRTRTERSTRSRMTRSP